MGKVYKPRNVVRRRTHGFFVRKRTHAGRRVLVNRRRKGRKRLTV